MKCGRCGAPMEQLFTSLACSAACDLKASAPETGNWDWALARIQAGCTVSTPGACRDCCYRVVDGSLAYLGRNNQWTSIGKIEGYLNLPPDAWVRRAQWSIAP